MYEVGVVVTKLGLKGFFLLKWVKIRQSDTIEETITKIWS
jgi:hypothetical protein